MKTYSSPFLVESGAGIETHTDDTCSGNEGQGVAPQTPPVHLQVCISRVLISSRPRICQRWECYMHVMISAGSSRGSLFVDQGPIGSNAVHIIIICQECLAHSPKVWSPADCWTWWASGKTWTQPCRGFVYNLAKLFVRLTN